MLHRPPVRRRRQRNDTRTRRRLAQREYRRRFDAGLITVAVEIDGLDGDVVAMLTATGWLKQAERDDRKKIATAIGKMIAEAAKR